MSLDRDRYYALVYGDPVKRFYQDGTFFRADGSAVDSGKTASPVKEKPKAAVVEQKKAESPASEHTALLNKLGDMHISKLKKLAVQVSEADGSAELPAMKGTGLKKRLIAYIAGNTD